MSDMLKELFKPEIISQLPFLALSTDGKVTANKVRLLEIGVVLGAFYMMFLALRADVAEIKPAIKQIPVMQSQIEALDKRQGRIEDYLIIKHETK